MELDGRVIRQMILFSLVVLIIPMILFPVLLGTQFMKSSLMNASFAFVLFEVVFYGFCLYFFNKETSLARLMINATICLVGRYTIGAILGLLIAAMYSMNVGIAIKFGVISFWPSVAMHMISIPFILKPLFMAQKEFSGNQRLQAENFSQPVKQNNSQEMAASFVAPPEVAKKDQPQMQTDYSAFQSHSPAPIKTQSDNGFDKAVHYIGENGSTLMAAVVDNEGLLLGSFQRAMFEAEDVAPLVLPILEQNKKSFDKLKLTTPEKTDMMFENQRLIIASEKKYTLVVVSERTVDDVLNIRINQALEMIRIYTAERYSDELIGNAERIYV